MQTESDLMAGSSGAELMHSQMVPRSENSSFNGGLSSAAKWVPDTMKRNCEICNAKFSKFFKRRHHCRQCGGVVCDGCSKFKDYVHGYQDTK